MQVDEEIDDRHSCMQIRSCNHLFTARIVICDTYNNATTTAEVAEGISSLLRRWKNTRSNMRATREAEDLDDDAIHLTWSMGAARGHTDLNLYLEPIHRVDGVGI